jgi:hypothetical protein
MEMQMTNNEMSEDELKGYIKCALDHDIPLSNLNVKHAIDVIEYLRCKNDIVYFANNYVHVCTVDGLRRKITLNDVQLEIIQKRQKKRMSSGIYSRQSGKTTAGLIMILHDSIFNINHKSAIFGFGLEVTNEHLMRIRGMIESLPDLFNAELVIKSKRHLELSNGSGIVSVGRKPDQCRGMTLTSVYIDEYRYVDTVTEIVNALFPVSSISRIFMTSS